MSTRRLSRAKAREAAARHNDAIIRGDLNSLDDAVDASVSHAAAALGRRGGRAGRGKAKRRSTAQYRRMASRRWADMTAEERSAEMSRRRKKGLKASRPG